jgi:hypothetical protein
MWTSLVARRTSRHYLSSCHVVWSMSAGIAEIAFLIRVFRSSSPLTDDHGRSQFLENAVTSLILFVTLRLLIERCAVISLSLGDWFLSQKGILHNAHFLAQSLFQKQLTEKRKDGRDGRWCNLLAPRNFRSFTMICRKLHLVCSNFLRSTIFQNPEGTLWSHCISLYPDFNASEYLYPCC